MKGPDGRGSGRRDAVLAALVALAVLLLGSIGVQRSRAVDLERRDAEDASVLGEVATDTALDLRERIFENLQAARRTLPGRPPAGFIPADPNAATTPVLDASARRLPAVAALLDRAVTTAQGLLGPPVDLGAGPRALVVSAVYQRGADGSTPLTTVTRRAQLLGWVVEPLDLGAVLEAHIPEGVVAGIQDGDVSWSAGGEVRSGMPEQAVQISDRQLVITAGTAGGVGFAGATVALAVSVVLLAAATGLAVHHAVRRQRDLRQESEDRAAQVRLIGEIAPVVQQSLELADVLPTVVVQLSDHYDLAGVSLAAGSGGTDELEMFGTGEAPDRAVRPVVQVPDHLAAGQTLALALQRGGRSVAVLRLVAGRVLDETELQSLRALTELVTAAVVNARLYASQQEALRRLRELDALKTVFLGTASHELRTPATAITGFASLLTASWDRFDEQQRRDFVDRIGANARSLSAVVQD
ncbi:MAG: histidine kinase dimerization/phospho-acceptor domain-containing protein, partial [Acidimicrobiales bacterium]